MIRYHFCPSHLVIANNSVLDGLATEVKILVYQNCEIAHVGLLEMTLRLRSLKKDLREIQNLFRMIVSDFGKSNQ